jgi:dienelactone hydrolase
MRPDHAERLKKQFHELMQTRYESSGEEWSGQVRLPAAAEELIGDLSIPSPVHGLVLFAHGSGSSRKSPRNRFVSDRLVGAGLATLRFDLLTPEEEVLDLETGRFRFDIPLLAGRLVSATDWVTRREGVGEMPLGYFGASTGAAAALIAAAERPERVRAVVSRGGRPDLAGAALHHVQAPTLLVVGGADQQVLELNRAAMVRLRCPAELRVVPGATHLFPEPGALEEVARHAASWFRRHFGTADWTPSDRDRLETSVRGE